MTDGAPDEVRKGIGFPTVAILGSLCGVAANFFGIAWVGVVFFAWLLGPILCGYFVRRHQIFAATLFNMLVMALPLLIAYSGPYPWTPNLDTAVDLGVLATIGLVFAQLAWLTAYGRRATKPPSSA